MLWRGTPFLLGRRTMATSLVAPRKNKAVYLLLLLVSRGYRSFAEESKESCRKEMQKAAGSDEETTMKGVGSRGGVAELMLGKDEGSKASDYANYFVSYAYLYHQKQMLTDSRRMHAYRDAIIKNKEVFAGKTVLDVGAGSGILSIWAAQAGAKKVYAVEFTSMADHAESLVKFNRLEEIVEVRKCAVEAIDLPENSIDIIISEWMGYFLLRESMLDSVLYARDHYMKKNGSIFPNRAHLYWAPADVAEERDTKLDEMAETLHDFEAFAITMKDEYGVNADCFRAAYEQEQRDYYLKQAAWIELADDRLLAPGQLLTSFDLYTATLDDVKGVHRAGFDFSNLPLSSISAFIGWFSVDFDTDGDGNTLQAPVLLDTAPKDGYTHWGQQAFFLATDIDHTFFPTTHGTLSLVRKQDAVRLYTVVADIENPHTGATKQIVWDLS